MADGLTGLRVIVTGAGSGIGQATASMLGRRGAVVAGLDLNLAGVPDDVVAVACDVADDGSVARAVATAADELGGIDVVVNNAGIGAQGTVADNTADEWHRVLDVNVVGIARVTRAALDHLRRSDAAAIVNVGSIAATTGLPNRVVYSASKGAVLAMTRAMAADFIREGIRVNCVNPGTASTPWVTRLLDAAEDPDAERAALEARQPIGRMVTAEEIAATVCFLADPSIGALTGAAVAVDGGMKDLRTRT